LRAESLSVTFSTARGGLLKKIVVSFAVGFLAKFRKPGSSRDEFLGLDSAGPRPPRKKRNVPEWGRGSFAQGSASSP